MTIKGSLQGSIAIVKAFWTWNFLFFKSCQKLAKKLCFLGGNGVELWNFVFGTPKKARPCGNWRNFTYRSWKLVQGLHCMALPEPPKNKLAESLCTPRRAGAVSKNPLSDRYEILHRGRCPRQYHPRQIFWPSVQGFWGQRGSNFPVFPQFSIDFHWLSLSSLKHSSTTVPACDQYCNNKLCYREDYSASVELSWCTLWHFSGENLLMAN